MAGENTTAADVGTLDGVQNKFKDLAAGLRNARTPLGQHHATALGARGGRTWESGTVRFPLSGGEVSDVSEDAVALIAGDVGKPAMDLRAMDLAHSTTITF